MMCASTMLKYKYRYVLLLCFINSIDSLYIPRAQVDQLYVVPFSISLNNSDGSHTQPFTSIQQALNHVRDQRSRPITINLYPTYYFVGSLRLTQIHSHLHITTMTREDADYYDRIAVTGQDYQRLTMASISGGIPIDNWKQTQGNIYAATVSQPIYINQLFIDDQRIVRTRVPRNFSNYLQYAAALSDKNQARYGFQFASGQFEYENISDAMVVIYHSWSASHHYVKEIDRINRTVYFSNPSDRPIGAFEAQSYRRFHIENICQALIPESFCFNNKTKTIYLMTNGTYDPNKAQIIAPINEFVLVIAGESANETVDDVNITNVAIQHGAWNINRTEQADYQAATFLQSATVYIANATSIHLSTVEISHTGSYGVWIKEGTTNISLVDSVVTDTGAGGIRIGQTISPVRSPTVFINISSNVVSYGGNVFPSGVGILSHRARSITIADNAVHHHRYSGISIGWEWGYAPSETSNVVVSRNYIHNIGQHFLNDKGGIYTLGVQQGTIITNNVIKNVYGFAGLMWGIYLDEGSSQIVVSNNVVYNTGWASIFQHYGANNTIVNNVLARASLAPPTQPDASGPDGCTHIARTENHTSWTFTRNIVYSIYQGASHSAFKADKPNSTIVSDENVYYNPYNTSFVFGDRELSFTEWQKTGQDKKSVIADPLFVGDVEQCDFFTIRADSPAAKFGFTNITKPTKWTPGCSTNYEMKDYQYYHW